MKEEFQEGSSQLVQMHGNVKMKMEVFFRLSKLKSIGTLAGGIWDEMQIEMS